MADAKRYRHPSEWKQGSRGAYRAAERGGYLKQATKHMIRKHRWTPDRLRESTKGYLVYSQWRAAEPQAYAGAFRAGMLDEMRALFTL
ncbi:MULTISPECIES: hypothetical protein [unclassified Ruegeria]|uniref:hypothetical protein n=1 Tax=unclassified Ruegeria TaxID=2625375 RepID=UPI001492A239|nr:MULTISPECIES: hypothetical protein [unclassified Ruegeria]NOD87906.1 hypothetical protein [Ruegeria sp. HKCCD4318]NOG08367.1 hypothetical protein [Ruegeria sp. HKCCD4315]